MKIILDAGHGGKDSGAVNVATGQREDRTNYNVVCFLAAMLTKAGHEVELLRKRHDENIGLNERQARIKQARPNLVISVHHNASNGKASGGEVIAQIDNKASTLLAGLIGEEWAKIGQKIRPIVYKKNSTGTADYYGILRAASEVSCPAVITEYAFIDNAEDIKRINGYDKQENEAKAIFEAIKRWI